MEIAEVPASWYRAKVPLGPTVCLLIVGEPPTLEIYGDPKNLAKIYEIRENR